MYQRLTTTIITQHVLNLIKKPASVNVNTDTSDEQQRFVNTPSKDDDTKGHDSQNVQHNQTTPTDDQKSESSNRFHLEQIVQQIIVHHLSHLQIKLRQVVTMKQVLQVQIK
ncbi:hypothetical protein NIT60_07290 [Mammaliicoccus sciuri]|nr:hypothetical protein NIT60_07290 [Mammaliicoccus sciuri]